MPLTKDFKETVKRRAERDVHFRNALLVEALEVMISGDFTTAKVLIRDYINATDGFDSVAKAVNKPPKSLMRMFGPSGNPNAKNLLEVTSHLQAASGVELKIVSAPKKRRSRKAS